MEQYANNLIKVDHGRLKHRPRSMQDLRTGTTAPDRARLRQNLRRRHYKLAIDAPPARRVAAAFTELTQAI